MVDGGGGKDRRRVSLLPVTTRGWRQYLQRASQRHAGDLEVAGCDELLGLFLEPYSRKTIRN